MEVFVDAAKRRLHARYTIDVYIEGCFESHYSGLNSGQRISQ